MQFPDADIAEVRKAQFPHNLFISGLFLCDILMTPLVIALNIGMAGLLIPLVFSCTLLAFIYLRSRQTNSPFVDAHWKLAVKRGKLLMLGYTISAALVLIAWLLSISSHDHNMEHILWTALTRVALMPTLIIVMVTAVLEFGSYAQAGKREIPE